MAYLKRLDRRIQDPVANFWSKVVRGEPDECWPWTGTTGEGYGQYAYWADEDTKKKTTSSRYAWMVTNGPIPSGFHVLHSCDNPICCNPAHLSAGTRRQNIDDMLAKGRSLRGELNHQSKLTDESVREIRVLVAAGVTKHSIANFFGVSPSLISAVDKRQIWRHVE